VLWDEAQRRLVSFREIRTQEFQETTLKLAAP
jgi:omega-6 fatty acid desaturase (delta-12 desaturase)